MVLLFLYPDGFADFAPFRNSVFYTYEETRALQIRTYVVLVQVAVSSLSVLRTRVVPRRLQTMWAKLPSFKVAKVAYSRASHQQKRKDGDDDGASLQVEPRKTSVTAKTFAKVLRLVYSNGLLEMLVGPWCYGQRVKISAWNKKDTDRAGLEGIAVWPDDPILAEWAKLSRLNNWCPHPGLNPGNALVVYWSDGKIAASGAGLRRDTRARCMPMWQTHDLQMVVLPQGFEAGATQNPGLQFISSGAFYLKVQRHRLAQNPFSFSETIDSPSYRKWLHSARGGDVYNKTLTAKKLGLEPKGRDIWTHRMSRYRSFCEREHQRELHQIWSKEKRLAKKRRFASYMDYTNLTSDMSDDASFEWWHFKELLG